MGPSSFRDVLRAELAYVRRRRFGGAPPRSRVKDGLVGLALSGGGIRSATTNLGILQTLAQLRILPLIDYLCTVSGGGYIGSCLSSLLSLDACDPPKPITPGSTPLFTTDWRRFPFNPTTLKGAAQIRHLRTHGSFLVTRKGMLKRETLRSVGQLLSGTVYHLVLALLTLTAIASLYMTTLFFGAHTIDQALRDVTRPVPTYTTAYQSEHPSTDQPTYRVDPQTGTKSVTELVGDGTLAYTVPVSYAFPSLWDRVKAKGDIVWGRVRDGIVPRVEVIRSIAFGAVVALIAFGYLARYRVISGHPRAVTPKPGESGEEALAVLVLRRAGRLSLLAVLVWLAVTFSLTTPPSSSPEIVAVLWLTLPVIVIATIRVTSWLLHVAMPRLNGLWTRDMRSLWGAFQATAVYALWAAVLLGALPILVYSVREYRSFAGISGIVALAVGRLLTFREGPDQKKRPISAALVRWALTLAIAIGLLLIVVTLCTFMIPDMIPEKPDAMWKTTGVWCVVIAAALLALGIVGDANRLSPHYFYRDRLAEAYLYTDETSQGMTSLKTMRDTVELKLTELHGMRTDTAPADSPEPCSTAPYHLISCAVNLAGSRDLTRKDRKSGYFIFSKYFCGSRHTGYRATSEYIDGEMKLARAVTISGAAASSGIGAGTFFAQAFATVLFNLRLGYWIPNPWKSSSTTTAFHKSWHFWPKWLWREVTMATDERHSMVNLSDGGHTGDNIGIYPLLQRRCRLIIACDAECDPSLSFGSFTEALRHAYIDLGIDVDIDLTMLRPDRDTGMTRSHCAVGLIRYPPVGTNGPDVGYLVYLKNCLTGDEPEPVLNYKSTHAVFPHESTADQFFDDAQFESYRALGVHIAEHAFSQWAASRQFNAWQDLVRPLDRSTV
jgi:hypothetical protein